MVGSGKERAPVVLCLKRNREPLPFCSSSRRNRDPVTSKNISDTLSLHLFVPCNSLKLKAAKFDTRTCSDIP